MLIMSSSVSSRFLPLRVQQTLMRSPFPRPAISSAAFPSGFLLKTKGLEFGGRHCSRLRCSLPIASIDENSISIPALVGEVNGEEEKNSHTVYPNAGIDLQVGKDRCGKSEPSMLQRAWKFVSVQRVGRRRRIRPGVLINIALITFMLTFLLFLDGFLRQTVRLQYESFYFIRPFLISAILAACAGWLYVPMVDGLKIHQILRKEGPTAHYIKKGTPTMGGLFFIPIGIAVAIAIAGQISVQLFGAAAATLAFAAIGLLDDLFSCLKGHNYGLPGWIKLCLQVAVGLCFSFWLDSTNIPNPYNMKLVVPFPAPIGLVHLGKFYWVLTAFCFAAMGNGVNLTDGLDGLAGGVSAWAFIGMSVAVLAICPDLAIFGASMAGACVGFLFHNRYKASIFMGDTGSLALGGALAVMASCTGMFFPLFISSGVFVMEVLSVIMQVSFMKATKRLYGESRRLLRMAPVHHHFELGGLKEPIIVAIAYFISCIFALLAGYIGLISA